MVPSMRGQNPKISSIIVGDGGETTEWTPFRAYTTQSFFYDTLRCQTLYTADRLLPIVGRTIDSVRYFISSRTGTAWLNTDWKVKVGISAVNDISDIQGFDENCVLTEVHYGALTIDNGNTLTIRFSQPFVYSGGNLLIEFSRTENGGIGTCYFQAEKTLGHYNFYIVDCPWGSSMGQWLPKTQFFCARTPYFSNEPLYCEDFESYDIGSIPTTWRMNTGCNYTNIKVKGSNYYNSTQSLFLSEFRTNGCQCIVLPDLEYDRIQDATLTFNYLRNATFTQLKVGVVTAPGNFSSFTPVATINTSRTEQWERKTVSFANYTGNGRYIAFKILTTRQSYAADAYIDNLMVTANAPTITQGQNNTVTISATPSTTLPFYVEYGPTGFSHGDGTSTIVEVAQPTQTIRCLNNSRTYDFYYYSDSLYDACYPTKTLTTTCCATCNYPIVNDDDSHSWGDTITSCNPTHHLKILTTSDIETRWYIDGTLQSSTDTALDVTFATSGLHNIIALQRGDCMAPEFCDTLRLTIDVRPTYNVIVYDTVDEVDLPRVYHGDEHHLPVSDSLYHLTSADGCDSLVSYNLHVRRTTCPTSSTMGRDFWVMFPYNGYDYGYDDTRTLSLIAGGANAATITVEAGPPSSPVWSTSADLAAGGHVEIELPQWLTRIPTNVSENHGIHVTSTADISLYASNYIYQSYDISTVLPTGTLGSHYIVQDYPGSSFSGENSAAGSEIGIVATEDNTQVQITPTASDRYHTAGETFYVTLNAGYDFQLLSNPGNTFSGTEIVSTNGKPIAVFQGTRITRIPDNSVCCGDYLFEQAIPVDYWGKEFILVPEQRNVTDPIRVTAAYDNCQIMLDGTLIATINAGQTYQLDIGSSAAHRLTCTKPVTVFLYFRGGGGNDGDPASVIIPPVEQGICSATLYAHNTTRTNSHYANIVTRTAQVAGMNLNGNSIASQFTTLVGTEYSYARVSITPGTHTLASSTGTFSAWFYGIGVMESYAYSAGMGLRILNRDTVIYDTVDDVDLPRMFNGDAYYLPVTDSMYHFVTVSGGDSAVHYNLHIRRTSCASSANMGRDFWVGFLHNGNCDYNQADGKTLQQAVAGNQWILVVSAETPGTVTATCNGWSTTVDLVPGGSVTINVPYETATATVARWTRPCYSRQIRNAGIHVTATTDIALYSYNYNTASFDATTVLPTNALGTRYILNDFDYYTQPGIVMRPDAYDGGEMCIVATEDNTTVDIEFHSVVQIDTFQFTTAAWQASSHSTHTSGTHFRTLTLQQGQYIQFITPGAYSFAGTEINSSKPVAVFMGRKRVVVPYARDAAGNISSSRCCADHIYEQAIPTNRWGKEFVIVPDHRTTNPQRSYFDIVSSENDCSVTCYTASGMAITVPILSAGENYLTNMSTDNSPVYISANKPVSVCLYLGSNRFCGDEGDPSSVIIPPVEQATNMAVYYAFDNLPSFSHRTCIVVPTAAVGGMVLDGTDISNQFATVGNTGYSYARMPITSGLHTLFNSQGRFNAWFYGMAGAGSYAYTAAMGLCKLQCDHLQSDTFAIVPDTLQWHDNIYRTSTTDTLHFTVANGCDSLSILHLTVSGWPDNVFDVDCKVGANSNAFEMTELFHTAYDEVSTMSTPMVADVDGDGLPEIVACRYYNSSNNSYNLYFSNGIVIYNGQTGAKKYEFVVSRDYSLTGQGTTLADVDGDGKAEIFILSSDRYILCYSYNPSVNNWTQKWISTQIGLHYLPTVSDLMGDGNKEVVCGPYIFNAQNGTLLLEGAMETDGKGFFQLVHPSNLGYTPYLFAVGDIDGDGRQEICAGRAAYKPLLTNYSGTTGNTWTLLRKAEDNLEIVNYDGETFLLDFDSDGDLDICVVGTPSIPLNATNTRFDTYAWDGQTTSIVAHDSYSMVTRYGPTIAYCGDLDGNGTPEIVYALDNTNGNPGEGGMMVYTYDSSLTGNMRLMHRHVPFSETAGFTVFDFNQDGSNEIIYQGIQNLYIVDGTTLDTLCTPLTSYNPTHREYPIVADVNGDGHAEILLARSQYDYYYDYYNYTDARRYRGAKGCIAVYSSSIPGAWSSARKVWNQWTYNSVNINEDLSVPRHPLSPAYRFPNNTQPFNKFLGQLPYIDTEGNLFNVAADAVAGSATATMEGDSIRVTVEYTNQGDAVLQAPYGISVYKNIYRGQRLWADTIMTSGLVIGVTATHTFAIPRGVICSFAASDSLIIALNDMGNGIAQHGGEQAECDTTNNSVSVHPPRVSSSSIDIQTACDSYTWIDGNTYTSSNNTTTHTLTNAAGCDSTITLNLTIRNSNFATETVTACNSFVWHGTKYTESTSTPTHNTTNAAGCDSVTTLHLTINHCSTTTLTVCDSYSWHGSTLTASGTYINSTDTLVLTVNHSSTGTDIQNHCDTYTWIDGLTYTASNNTATQPHNPQLFCRHRHTKPLRQLYMDRWQHIHSLQQHCHAYFVQCCRLRQHGVFESLHPILLY